MKCVTTTWRWVLPTLFPEQVWFRNDLRVDDNAPLSAAVKSGRQVVPCMILDPDHYSHLLQSKAGIEGARSWVGLRLLHSSADSLPELAVATLV